MRQLGAGPGGPRTLLVLGLLAALKALSLIGIAEAVARGVVGVIVGDDNAWRAAILLGLGAALLRAAITWAIESYATRAAIGAKEGLRHQLAERLLAGTELRVGSATAVATVGLDELDHYFRSTLPAVVTAATLPLLIGTRILFADWVSALIVVLTVPLVPVFMALVGMHTRDQADAASATLQRLSDHLVELARGLPVLVGLGRVEEQAAALRQVSAEHRTTTMRTLRSAFLSSLVLELISTISVAVVAVFVGVRLVQGELPLELGLLALVLAPECFAPFRELGAAFHASQDGLAAHSRAKAIIDSPLTASARRPGRELRVESLTVNYDDRSAAAVEGFDFRVPRGSILSIEGPSGSGKSTVLGVLAGEVQPSHGTVHGIDVDSVAWVPQHPHTVGATVRDELRLYADDDHAVDAALGALGLMPIAEADPARISPGELRRLAVARGLVRVAAGAELLLLDEPTAHLDPANARLVENAIEGLRGSVTIVLASHEAGVTRLADHVLLLGGKGGARAVTDPEPLAEVSATADVADAPGVSALAELLAFLRPAGWRVPAAILLGTGASLFAIALTAVSGWLIVRASEQPPIMYLLVAIVGVRFFGIGRAALRYSERLLTHDAVLGAVVELRMRLWNGLAVRGLGSRALASGSAALDYLVASADRVRDLVPRVILPPAVAVTTSLAALIAVAALHAPAVPVLLSGLAVSLILAPAIALVADRAASRSIAAVRTIALRQFAGTVAAADELRANGISERMLARLDELDRRTGDHARRSAWALGLGNGLVVLACAVTAMSMLAVSAPAVAAGTLPGAVVAVLVLVPLGLVEPLLGLVDALQQWPALSSALVKVRAVTSSPAVLSPNGHPVDAVERLDLEELTAAWSGAASAAFGPVTASAVRGDWVVVEGPSGAGKSTLLATLLGYLPAASGRWLVNGTDAAALDPGSLRSRFAWCPQEAHLFDSTIRGNLLLARDRDDRPSEDELKSALVTVGLGPLLASLPEGLDTRVGPAGDRLSGGERQRLAVARTLLTRADVVLLDEPTAHLDALSAERLIGDLRERLRDRIVVLVSHHPDERRAGDVRVVLGAGALAVSA